MTRGATLRLRAPLAVALALAGAVAPAPAARIAAPPAPRAAHAAPRAAPPAPFFWVERVAGRLELRSGSLAPGATAELPCDPFAGVVDVVLPVGPGQSASLVRPGDRGTLVVSRRGDSLHVALRRPDGTAHARPPRSLADLAREETRLSVTGGDGTRGAWVIRGGAVATPDTTGPVANMFAGKLPFRLAGGDWVVQTETWRRPAAPAPRGRLAFTRERWLLAEVTRPDGARGRFVVDLGAGESVVAPGFVPAGQAIVPAKMTEYSLRGDRLLDYQPGGATGLAPVVKGHTTFPSLAIGGADVRDFEAQVAELPAGLGADVAGILGADVLRRAARVRLVVPDGGGAAGALEFDPKRPLAREDGRAPFSWVSSHVVLPGEVAGRAALWIVDSGAPVSFVDPPAVAEEPWTSAARPAPPVHGAGGQPRPTSQVTAPSLRVGSGAAWPEAPVRLARLMPFDALRADGRVPALLGVAELARMGALDLDFERREARWGAAPK